MILLIDDERDFRSHVGAADVIARTTADGLSAVRALLDSGQGAQVWLDHDLGEVDGVATDVMPVVDLLLERAADAHALSLVVHTQNSVGGQTMVRSLRRAGLDVNRVDARTYLEVVVR